MAEEPKYAKKPPVAVEWEKKLLGLGLAQMGLMLDDAQKVLKEDRQVVAQHHHQNLGTPAPGANPEEDVIHVGDTIQHVYPPPVPAANGGALRSVAKAALLGAALLGTGGLGAGGALGLAHWLNRPAAPAVEPEGQEWEIRWKLKDGKWVTEGGPVKDK